MRLRRVALVRHPRPDVAPGICYGRLDVGLADDSGAATKAILAALATFPRCGVWTSPAARCRPVAEAIATTLGGLAQADARLLELDFGNWEGRPWDDVPRAALDLWAADPMAFEPPGGESGRALAARVSDFHAMLAARSQDAIVVAHGGPLKLLAALLRGRPIDLLAPAQALGSVEILNVTAQGSPPSP